MAQEIWFVIRDGKEYGPYSPQNLKDMAGKGQIIPDDMVRRHDMAVPRQAKLLKGLFLAPPPPQQQITPTRTAPPPLQPTAPTSVHKTPVFWKLWMTLVLLIFCILGAVVLLVAYPLEMRRINAELDRINSAVPRTDSISSQKSDSNSTGMEAISDGLGPLHKEIAGKFEFRPPADWVVREHNLSQYKVHAAAAKDGFSPNINFIEVFNFDLNEELSKITGEIILRPAVFKLDSGAPCLRYIITGEVQNRKLRFVQYIIRLDETKSMGATFTSLAADRDRWDVAVDKSIRTFSSSVSGISEKLDESARPKMEKTDPVEKVVQSGESVTNSIGMELIEIPAGKFTMGSPEDEKDRRDNEAKVSVTLTKPFWLGKYEVTQGQWKSVMGTDPWDGQDFVKADKDCPATYVSYFDAVEFCEKLTDLERAAGTLKADEEYHLPTETQLERACRAGTETAFSFGDDEKQLGQYAWFDGNTTSEQYAHKVGLKKPNPWGLHDMHGNVWEWCSDWYGEKLAGGIDPAGPEGGSYRVNRAGGYGSNPGDCRSALRIGDVPSNRFNYLGFRVARSQSKTVTRPKMEKTEPVEKVVQSGESVTNSIGIELIEISAGAFTMGEGEGVAVTLTQEFSLGKTEVTQGQWKSVMGSEPWKGQTETIQGENVAATYVNYDDAADFCERLTDLERKAGKMKANEEYRLPTEAEWEYACRAGTTTAFSFGDDESQFSEYGWFNGNIFNAGDKCAHKVGLKKPNPWGLYDMHGNVWEWCSDWYGSGLSGGTDPAGPEEGMRRVLRGGGWWNAPGTCRSAIRVIGSPSMRGLGFRVARSHSETVTRLKMQKTEPVEKVVQSGESVTNSIGIELIEISAGAFTMGESEGVTVTLTQGFFLGKTEVTQGQWQQVMGKVFHGQKYNVEYKNFPALGITWDEATEFCQKLTATEHNNDKLPAGESYRLPTEAEWEYACRAGTTTAFSFGDDESKLGEYAWFEGNTLKVNDKYAHKVGMKKPNPWGLYDMHGNVWEWCSDRDDGKLSGGVSRGGSWRNDPGIVSAYRRLDGDPSDRNGDLGFRVARSQSAQ